MTTYSTDLRERVVPAYEKGDGSIRQLARRYEVSKNTVQAWLDHKQGAKPIGDEPLDRTPICFNVRKGVREQLKTVPDWRERLREFVDRIIEESGQSGSDR
jgi:transposase-like protein